MAHEHHAPHPYKTNGADRRHDSKSLLRNELAQKGAHGDDKCRNEQRVPRYMIFIELGKTGRRLVVPAQIIENPACGEHPAVASGSSRS
ncbi:hypothetical protein D3C72_2192640 [compost metagenome]